MAIVPRCLHPFTPLSASAEESQTGSHMKNTVLPIQKSKHEINWLYWSIQLEDQIGIGRPVNQTFLLLLPATQAAPMLGWLNLLCH
jgi:hypothetical protein